MDGWERILQTLLKWLIVTFEFLKVVAFAFYCVLELTFRCFVPERKKCVRDQIVLITGAGHGLGRLLAINFARLGAKVVLWDVNQENNNHVAEEITQIGGRAWTYVCDVSDETQVESAARKVRRDVGDVHILINNAGVLPGKPILRVESSRIRKTLEINTLSHFWTVRQFLPHMLERGEGHIVAVSSIAGILGCANLTDYCASKHAVIGMMAALREELHESGAEEAIHLTVVCPLVMNTGLVQKPRTRFPSIFPILEVEKVAHSVTNGILRNKEFMCVPPITLLIYKILNLFPFKAPIAMQRFFQYSLDPNDHN